MNKNLESYVKLKKRFLDKPFCKKVVKNLHNFNWQPHIFTKNSDNTTTFKPSGDQELEFAYSETNDKYDEIILKKLWEEVHSYITNLNFPWFDGWRAYSQLRYNKYKLNKKMAEHSDHITSLFKDGGIPILSIIIGLNDNYKGGEFIMFKDKEYKIEAGDIIIFPSNFLYPHKVMPVTKGIRYSAVSWVW